MDASSEPRLWGEGRPGALVYGASTGGFCSHGAVRFGLSKIAVGWGSAAAACPEGTWVCTLAERLADTCNTGRPEATPDDAMFCDGQLADNAADSQFGWVSDARDSKIRGTSVTELGQVSGEQTCISLPVWCCFE